MALMCGGSLWAQDAGGVGGVVVSSWNGAPLPGVAITVRGTLLAAQTDASGHYLLTNVPPGDHVLRFSKPGFAAVVVTDVRVLPGQTATANGNLRPEIYEMEEYEVTAEEFTTTTDKILFERGKSALMVDALGSDFLGRVGVANAAESLTKVSGAAIVDGKFAVIRGLNDRYVTTTLNGAAIPSADPYRQSASLDLFPAQVIDRVVVAKTFTPDQPGTFTGGGIDIVTRSFPEKPFLSVSLGGAYNPQANLNDKYLSYKGGSLDWAGMDDGSRALPKELNGVTPPPPPPSTGPSNSATYSQKLNDALLLDRLSKAMGATDFAPKQEAAPLNHNFSMAGGGSKKVGEGLFGYFAGGSYKHDYSFYDNGVSRRYGGVEAGTDTPELRSSFRDARALSIVNWAAMVSLAYKPMDDHEVAFVFFYNQNGTDDSRVQDQGTVKDLDGEFRKFNLYWTERNLNTFQLKGNHRFQQLANLRFDWLAALTQTTQDEPDARFFNDLDVGGGFDTGSNGIPNPNKPTRYFRMLEENNRNEKLDWTLPIDNWTDEEAQLKWGLFDSYSKRDFTERAFWYPGHGGYNGDPNQFLDPANLGLRSARTNRNGNIIYTWGDVIQVFDSSRVPDSLYNGERTVQAGYLMMDLPVVNKLRIIGGARYETTDLKVHSESYLNSSVTSLKTNDSKISQNDLLPAIGLIWQMTDKMNLRLNYSQTVARPSFRELAAYYSYDPTISDFIEGNPGLIMTSIENYDARWEWFPRPGEVLSVSLFYKDLKNAIERSDLKVDAEVITFKNRPKAKLYGIELEARKNLDFLSDLLNYFSIGGNLSLVKSEAELLPEELQNKQAFFPDISSTRPLFDQSPYILNLDFNYDNPHSGTTMALVFNVAGPRIVITKLNAPDVYERPAPALDFILSQKIGRHVTLKFSAKNLLDPDIKRTYGETSNLLYSNYKKGRTFGIAFNYDF